MDHEEGNVVVVATGQAGSVIQVCGSDVWVLLANNDIWVGSAKQALPPQSAEHLAACPLEIERFEERERKNFVAKA